jgi:hypothetical protein
MSIRIGRNACFVLVAVLLLLAPTLASAQDGTPGQVVSAASAPAIGAPVQFIVFSGAVAHAAAGTGMRNAGFGTIRLRGVPTGATVTRGFLYFSQICATTPCPAAIGGTFESHSITLSLIASSANPCWSGGPIGAYRADVTGLLPATSSTAFANKTANGDFRLAGFPSGDKTGADPWVATQVAPLAEGATLVVVYSHPSLSATGKVYIHNGADTLLGGTLDLAFTLAPAAPSPLSSVIFTRFGADGQVGSSVAANGSSIEDTFFGPNVNTLTQIAGDASTLNHDSDWNGSDGGPLNQLWDTHTSAIGPALPGGATTYSVRYVAPGDCITPIGHVLTVR